MTASSSLVRAGKQKKKIYRLDDQVGFILRQVSQRHTALFTSGIGCDLTAMQWATMSKLAEMGPVTQNMLGRQTAMDAATIKGVVDRLTHRGLVATQQDAKHGRRLIVTLTDEGAELVESIIPNALAVTEETLARLTSAERKTLIGLLLKLR